MFVQVSTKKTISAYAYYASNANPSLADWYVVITVNGVSYASWVGLNGTKTGTKTITV